MEKKPFGVLILHGLSACLDCVSGIQGPVLDLGLPTRMPVLRGHGGDSPEQLHGVKWEDWTADGQAALDDLLQESEKAIVFGHSMGGLAALDLGGSNDGRVDSLILAAPALAFSSALAPFQPLNFLTPLITKFMPRKGMPPKFVDPAMEEFHGNYPWIPIESVTELFEYQKVIRKKLPQIDKPFLLLASRNDSTVSPDAVEMILRETSTRADQKSVTWFEKTEHEMFLDIERTDTIQAVVDYIQKRMRDG